MLMKHTTASGSHSPDIVQEKQRSWQFVCLPTLHFLSLLILRRGFGRTPTNHTILKRMDFLNYAVTKLHHCRHPYIA